MMLTSDKPSGLITELGVLGLSSVFSLLWKLIKLFIFSCIIIGSVKAITAGIESPTYLFSAGVYIGLWRIANLLLVPKEFCNSFTDADKEPQVRMGAG